MHDVAEKMCREASPQFLAISYCFSYTSEASCCKSEKGLGVNMFTSKKLALLGLLLIAIALPLAIFFSQKLQDAHLHAATRRVSSFTRKLTWSPPKLVNPQTITLSTDPQTLKLDNTKDYILQFPSTPVVAQFNDDDVLFISGGHNIVMIGGEIHIPDLPDTLHGVSGNDNQRQAMRLNDQTGTVFIEGLEVSGVCMDFLDISAPQARVILQNVRVEGCRSHFESLTEGYTDEHPDLIQPWGGVREIDIDGFTGFSDYQGLTLNSDLGVVGNIVVKHTNIGPIAAAPQYGRYFIWEDCNSDAFPDCANNPFAPEYPHWDLTDDSFYIQPAANRALDDSVWPPSSDTQPRQAVLAPDGKSVSWPNYTAKIDGRVQLGPPPAGDFVPAGSVGIGYVSPGYVNGT